jgi:Ca2+-binding EF-hand superfamily protein
VARTRSLPLLAGLVGLLCLSAAEANAKPRAAAPDRALKAVDTDSDGTIDLREAQAGGSAVFDRLDGDKDGTLTIRELQGRVSRSDFKSADPDNDGTLTRQEFLAVLERRFKAADPDNDGTLDRSELATPAGAALLRLLK